MAEVKLLKRKQPLLFIEEAVWQKIKN